MTTRPDRTERDAVEAHYRAFKAQFTSTSTGEDMNITDAFPSNWLRAADLKGREATVTISEVGMETFQDGSSKPYVKFVGKDKGAILNKTNSLAIADTLGPDTDAWIGKEIVLFSMKVQGPQGLTDGIRVRVPGGMSAPANPAADKAAASAVEGLDDDIPW